MQTAIPNTMQGNRKVSQKPGVHSFGACQSRSRRASGGFTLIEILVSVSIIILLLGIGFVAGGKFITQGKITQTRSMLQGLVGANDEFKAARQQGDINHAGNFPIKWNQVTGATGWTSSKRFVYACRQNKNVELQMLAAVQSGENRTRQALQADDSLKDVWGSLILYRASNDGVGSLAGDKDQTNVLVTNDKLPLSPSPFFVSAGPDKKFGTEDDITTIENPSYK